MPQPYELAPRQLGCEVKGINLQTENRPEVIEQIKKDVATHRLLFFKTEGIISGKRHVEISKWFGELESTFTKHEKSPDLNVFRVSNDANEGCVGVGRRGWHIDGTYHFAPYPYSLYHMVSVPTKGATLFVPLTEIIENLEPEKRSNWDQLWMKSDREPAYVHPLIYKHPITRKPVLCFHLGMLERYIWNYNTPQERICSDEETKRISQDIYEEITVKNKNLIYKHDWKPEEFIISDNLAVGHEAAPESQFPRSEVGLRVLHRTTTRGTQKPEK